MIDGKTRLKAPHSPHERPIRRQALSSETARPPFWTIRRVALLLGILAALAAYWIVVGQPQWREYQYRHSSFERLANLCSSGDYHASRALRLKAIALGHPERAVDSLEDCLAAIQSGAAPCSRSDKAEVEGDLALVLVLSFRTEEAAPYFRHAIEDDFSCAAGHLAFATWLEGHNSPTEAANELKIVTALEPKNDQAWFQLSHVYVQSVQLDQGRAAALKAIAINPRVPAYWQELGDSYGYAMRHEDSLKAYREELKLAPDSVEALADAARAEALTARTQDDYTGAVKDLQRVLKMDTTNKSAGYILLGELHLRFGHAKEAAQSLETAISFDDTIPEVFYKLSTAYELIGEPDKARDAITRFQEMDRRFRETTKYQKELSEMPNRVDLHLAIARDWEYYKAWPQVIREYKVIAALQPGNKEIARKLADLERLDAQGKLVMPNNYIVSSLMRTAKSSSFIHRRMGDLSAAGTGSRQ